MDPVQDPPPNPPDPGDCCGEGCANCVFDQHERALERYRLQLAAWRNRQGQSPN